MSASDVLELPAVTSTRVPGPMPARRTMLYAVCAFSANPAATASGMHAGIAASFCSGITCHSRDARLLTTPSRTPPGGVAAPV